MSFNETGYKKRKIDVIDNTLPVNETHAVHK